MRPPVLEWFREREREELFTSEHTHIQQTHTNPQINSSIPSIWTCQEGGEWNTTRKKKTDETIIRMIIGREAIADRGQRKIRKRHHPVPPKKCVEKPNATG